jgi:hypothetical protein
MKQKMLFKNGIKMLSLIVFIFITEQTNAQTVTTNIQSTHNGFF